MAICTIVSFRLGLTDGVSIVAESWRRALTSIGYDVRTVAGEGPVDRTVSGLAIDAPEPPSTGEVEAALGDADLVVVENLLTIPMNLPASLVVAEVLRGRPAILHHHDPPWQRERYAHVDALPPHDPAWRHVTINELTRRQMAERGIDATCIHNGFDPHPPPGDRDGTRRRLGVHDDEILLVHPVRAIPRKRVDVALRLVEQLGATYWLPGPAEEGFQAELDRLLARTGRRVLRDHGIAMEHVYAACDGVLFPSSWEGFGNPPVEAAIHRRPAVVGSYPVADELRALGFRWFSVDDLEPFARFLRSPDTGLLDHNQEVARTQLSTDVMTERLRQLLDDAGWAP